MKQRIRCGVLVVALLASTALGCRRDHSSGPTSDVGEGVTQLAPPDATVQPTKRREGTTTVPEIYNEADAALAAQDYVRAQELYRQAIAADPRSAQGYIGLGTALMLSGDATAARSSYQDALARDPNSSSAHIGLGSVESVDGHYQAAVDDYLIVLRARPDDPDAHWGLALAYQSLGDSNRAALHARRFLALVPNSPMAPQLRGIAEGG